MGGAGSGRHVETREIRTPIIKDMYLPNLSGIQRHPESVQHFLKIDGSNANQNVDIGTYYLENNGIQLGVIDGSTIKINCLLDDLNINAGSNDRVLINRNSGTGGVEIHKGTGSSSKFWTAKTTNNSNFFGVDVGEGWANIGSTGLTEWGNRIAIQQNVDNAEVSPTFNQATIRSLSSPAYLTSGKRVGSYQVYTKDPSGSQKLGELRCMTGGNHSSGSNPTYWELTANTGSSSDISFMKVGSTAIGTGVILHTDYGISWEDQFINPTASGLEIGMASDTTWLVCDSTYTKIYLGDKYGNYMEMDYSAGTLDISAFDLTHKSTIKTELMQYFTGSGGGSTTRGQYARLLDDATSEYTYYIGYIPENYKAGGTLRIRLRWCMVADQAGTNAVRLQWRVGNAPNPSVSSTLPTDTTYTYQTESLANNEAQYTLHDTTFDFTGNAGDLLTFLIYRVGGDAADTATGDMAMFIPAILEYESEVL